MHAFEKLQDLVEKGELEITHILAPPRTMSTIYERGLAEAEKVHGQLHEPFLKQKVKGFEEGCDFVLQRVEELQERHASEAPIRLVLKDIADSFSEAEWKQWQPLIQNFSVIVREPHLQLYSLMKSSVKRVSDTMNPVVMLDIMAQYIQSDKGADVGYLQHQVIEYFRDLAQLTPLADGRWQYTDEHILQSIPMVEAFVLDFNTHAYDLLSHHVASFEQHAQEHPGKQFAYITALGLKNNHQLLTNLADYLGLGDVHEGQWVSEYVDIGDIGKGDTSWHTDAKQSVGLRDLSPKADVPKVTDWFPQNMRQFLLAEALPAYINILCNNHMHLPKASQRAAIAAVNPIGGYAMAMAARQRRLDGLESEEELEHLRNNNPSFKAAFDAIDKTIQCIDHQSQPVVKANHDKADGYLAVPARLESAHRPPTKEGGI